MLKCVSLEKKTVKEYSYGEKYKFILKNDGIYIPCIVNGLPDTLFYDSGLDDGICRWIYSDTCFKIKPIMKHTFKSATKIHTVKQGLVVNDIQTQWFNFSKYVSFLKYNKIKEKKSPICEDNKRSVFRGKEFMLGNNVFMSGNYAKGRLLLTFSDTTITLLDTNSIYDTTGYIKLDVNFKTNNGFSSNIPQVKLVIDTTLYEFMFDTGSDAYIILSDKTLHRKEKEIVYVGEYFYDLSGAVIDTVSISVNPVVMSGMDTLNTPIMFMKSINHNNMGIRFISQFDWIIDKHKGVMYAKPIFPIIKERGESIKLKAYKTKETTDGNLTIVAHKLNQEKVYPLGTIIKSVNGEAITAENICDYKKKLNNTNDWSKLELEVELPQEKEEIPTPEEPQNTKKSKKEKKK